MACSLFKMDCHCSQSSCRRNGRNPWMKRSEEHTSELQSQSNLVCRLLLEKKNSVCSLPPCGGGLGRGVARLGAASPRCTSSATNRYAPGGGEATALAAVTDSTRSERDLRS